MVQLCIGELVLPLPLSAVLLTRHRSQSWQLRLVSLLAASNPSPVRSAGFQLLHHTFTSSSTFFLAASKQTLTAAQQVLAAPISKVDPTLYLAAVEVAKLIIAKSTWYPEWARDNVGAQTVQKFVSTMVQAVNESASLQASLLIAHFRNGDVH